jgi:adenine-specific DNA-methyltransferase
MPANARTPRSQPLTLRAAPHVATLTRARELIAEAASPSERSSFARVFCAAAVSRWWAAVYGEANEIADCPVAIRELGSGAAELAGEAGEEFSALPRELAAYLLSTLYAGLLPDEQRASDGVFYTPPALVDRLLSLAEDNGVHWHEHRVLDPAAGGGAFLSAVALRISNALAARGASAGKILNHVSEHLTGVEIDPFSAWLSHVFLEATLWDHCVAAGERLRVLVRERDALGLPDGWNGGYDLVVGNPPYGRLTLDENTRKRFARSLHGHANLYGVFTDLAVRLCRPEGVVALVTPASFLGGQYFKRLRQFLIEQAPPVAIDFVSDRSGVFDEVLQETVLVVFAKNRHPSRVSVRLARPTSLSGPCRVADIAQVELSGQPGRPWILPRSQADAALLDRASAMPHRLSDYGLRVSTGPLVWNRHKPQLTAERGPECYPLIWAESVLPEGEFRFRSDRRNHQPYFHLHPGQSHLLIRSPVILLQRTTAKEQTRRLIAAVLPQSFLDDHGGAVVENHLNMVRPAGVRSRVPLDAVAALLNSHVVDTIFRCTNGSVAVSAYELESIPVPPLEAMQQLHTLLEARVAPAAVEAFLRRTYGQAAEAAA